MGPMIISGNKSGQRFCYIFLWCKLRLLVHIRWCAVTLTKALHTQRLKDSVLAEWSGCLLGKSWPPPALGYTTSVFGRPVNFQLTAIHGFNSLTTVCSGSCSRRGYPIGFWVALNSGRGRQNLTNWKKSSSGLLLVHTPV